MPPISPWNSNFPSDVNLYRIRVATSVLSKQIKGREQLRLLEHVNSLGKSKHMIAFSAIKSDTVEKQEPNPSLTSATYWLSGELSAKLN